MGAPGEFEIIERWFTRPSTDPAVRVGIGDDAAIVEPAGPIAITVDMLIAGTHFPETLSAHAIGHRVLAVNLSDLAAMGAKPRWATLAISLPEADPEWLDGFAAGFYRLAERYGVSLIGGDTTRGPLSACLQLIGDAPAAPLLRSGGRAGDRIFVSGALGDSAAALEHFATVADARRASREQVAISEQAATSEQAADSEQAATRERSARAATLIERFSYPEPRVALGRALAGVANAAIDVSDGLVADLGHLCRQSGVGAVIELDALPLSAPLRALHGRERAEAFALHGGDDYELCFTAAPGEIGRVHDIAARVGTPVAEIGELTADTAIRGRRNGATLALDAAGYVHF
jgi:thiamine-monophosphate kinase